MRDAPLTYSCVLANTPILHTMPLSSCPPMLHRQKREAAQIKLSSVARAVIERERLEREACGATVLQASWRGYNARKALETSRAARRTLEGRRATKLQVQLASEFSCDINTSRSVVMTTCKDSGGRAFSQFLPNCTCSINYGGRSLPSRRAWLFRAVRRIHAHPGMTRSSKNRFYSLHRKCTLLL